MLIGFPLNGIDLIDDLVRLFATKISRRESFGQIGTCGDPRCDRRVINLQHAGHVIGIRDADFILCRCNVDLIGDDAKGAEDAKNCNHNK